MALAAAHNASLIVTPIRDTGQFRVNCFFRDVPVAKRTVLSTTRVGSDQAFDCALMFMQKALKPKNPGGTPFYST